MHRSLRSGLLAPVVSLSHFYGWLLLANKIGAREFSVEDERTIAILCAQLGRIYENGSLYADVAARRSSSSGSCARSSGPNIRLPNILSHR